ncbi:DNA-binding transcriptional MerR regulator [Paenibacillus sp. 1182]|uniref:MerR family transcriptional regulator n=1 Tax=Paenibacillus sp. 1182 TaxID=2806565 RepID=UPI001AE3CAA5|nr:MerR family transcriptional regulator [Paenibacillus sp. 1182]MBP1308717.1 DNA-binding transcriptional MerR regulator [Paenibacillus sp. 1182]
MNSNQQPIFKEAGTGSRSVDMPSEEGLISISDLANQLHESVYVLRNWIRDLRPHIPISKNEVGHNLFNEEAVRIMKIIQQLHREKGYSMKEIEYYLVTNGNRKISVIDSAHIKIPEKSLDYQGLLNQVSVELRVAIQSVLQEVSQLRKEVALLRAEKDVNELSIYEPTELYMDATEQPIDHIDHVDIEAEILYTRCYVSRYKRERRKRWPYWMWVRMDKWIQSISL